MKPAGHGSHDLIKALVDLQSMELDDRKKLLVTLIDEREELLKKIELLSSPNSSLSTHNQKYYANSNRIALKYKDRSSMNILAQITKPDFVYHDKAMLDSGSVLFYSISSPPSPPLGQSLPLTPDAQQLAFNSIKSVLPSENQSGILSSKDGRVATHPNQQNILDIKPLDKELHEIDQSIIDSKPNP